MKKFSLKKRTASKDEKKLGAFSLKNTAEKPLKSVKLNKNSIFGDNQHVPTENEDVAITSIDEVNIDSKDEPLIITPVVNETSWEHKRDEIRKRKLNDKKQGDDTDALARGILQSGIKEAPSIDNNSLKRTGRINIESYPDPPTSESYKKVPINQFGMAMLRGMGWTPEYEREKAKNARQYN